MARGGGKKEAGAAVDPAADERARLKKLAFSTNMLSQTKLGRHSAAVLAPSKTVVKHHGCDIFRKSQRKNRFLFSFPGLLAPVSGGKIGELKDLGTKNPVLYLDFPQGRMKLFGTIVYPKNRYLTLQFSKGGKNVTCDDYFDNMIVFSDAWWIGTKEENPEELQLQYPKEMNMEKHINHDFKGGVGATSVGNKVSVKSSAKCLEEESPDVSLDDDITDSPDNKDLTEVTPARQSARTAGKTFNFAEASGDDLIGNEDETPEEDDEKVDTETPKNMPGAENPSPVVFEVDNYDNVGLDPASGQRKRTGKTKDPSDSDHISLVQTTLSSLFKKVEEKKVKKNMKQPISTSEASKLMEGGTRIEERESGTVTKEQKKQPKRKELLDSVTPNQRKLKSKASGTPSLKKGKVGLVPASQSSDPDDSTQVEDDIEEFSSTSKDDDPSDDEDWTA